MADGEQLSLLRAAARRRPTGPGDPPLAERTDAPIARVVVDLPLPHLDHPFDYTVPVALSAAARPGVRVKVRFAGQDVDAFVVERLDSSDHAGRLSPLRRVVSAEPVLTPESLRLFRAVADRYAGTLSDVLRLALPPRHAATERADRPDPEPPARQPVPTQAPELPGPWGRYRAGAAFLARLDAGQAPRAVWTALPGSHWVEALATAIQVTLAAGRGAVVVLPDRRDVDRLDSALTETLGPDQHARLEADLGPAARYAAFLACLRGQVRVAIGTRAAAFAPVAELGLAVVWDDGDDQHAEQRAPYPHVREVLALRAEQQSAAMLVGGWSVSTEAALLLRRGWARPIEADRTVRRSAWPRVVPAADAAHADTDPAAAAARIPSAAWRAVQHGLTAGPVLVQVARAGYAPAVACQDCRRPARCPHCTGPIRLPEAGSADCAWCGRVIVAWACPHCAGRALRALRIGAQRTADELGRAFPSARVVLSRPERTLPEVGERPAIVVATPGVEPVAPRGYAAAVLLDAQTLLARADLRAGEEALRRWRAAAALVRPVGEGGVVVVCADPADPAVQALVRGDPGGFAAHELEQRGSLAPGGLGGRLGLPPAVTAASVRGSAEAVAGLLAASRLPAATQVDGPVPVEDDVRRPGPAPGAKVSGTPAEQVRYVLRVPVADGADLARALHAAAAVRSARRDPGPVRIQIDPRDLG